MTSGGPEAIKALKSVGKRPAKRDLPPRLRWEWPVWLWFMRTASCPPLGGPPTVDGAAWRTLCADLGWSMDVAFHLVGVIERGYAEHAEQAQTHEPRAE